MSRLVVAIEVQAPIAWKRPLCRLRISDLRGRLEILDQGDCLVIGREATLIGVDSALASVLIWQMSDKPVIH